MKIEHIALYVNDLEAAKDFFVRYFDAVPNAGYHNPRTDFRSYFLTFADGARLELMNKPGMSDELIFFSLKSMHQSALLITSVPNIPLTFPNKYCSGFIMQV